MGLSIPWSKMARPAKEPSYPFGTVLQHRNEVHSRYLMGSATPDMHTLKAMYIGENEGTGRIRVLRLTGTLHSQVDEVYSNSWEPADEE